MSAHVSIVIPAYNEEENLKPLVTRLLQMIARHHLNAEILLVDDHSTDSTPQLCDQLARQCGLIRVLHRAGQRGMGNTLKEGTEAARGDIIVWTMADLSDDAETIPQFIRKIEDGADMVMGSRYMKGGSSGDLSRAKLTASKGFSVLSSLLVGTPVDDITNAFRGFRKEVFDSLSLESEDFGISPEFALKAHIRGFILDQVPTSYTNRLKGTPNFKMLKMSRRYAKVLMRACMEKYLKQ